MKLEKSIGDRLLYESTRQLNVRKNPNFRLAIIQWDMADTDKTLYLKHMQISVHIVFSILEQSDCMEGQYKPDSQDLSVNKLLEL